MLYMVPAPSSGLTYVALPMCGMSHRATKCLLPNLANQDEDGLLASLPASDLSGPALLPPLTTPVHVRPHGLGLECSPSCSRVGGSASWL
jgi:hypothetical protein